MELIHLTIQGREFNVPKNILEKSGLIRELLKLQDNNLELKNINPNIFELVIRIATENDAKNQILTLCDYLDFDRIELFNDCYCIEKGCNNISLNKKYCVSHKCQVDDCNNIKIINYCYYHTCQVNDCNKLIVLNSRFCELHKCKKCNEIKYTNDLCLSHVCCIIGCDEIKLSYYSFCNLHKCNIIECNQKRIYKDVCRKHLYCLNLCSQCNVISVCKFHECYSPFCCRAKLPHSNYCLDHACKFEYCYKKCTIGEYCDEHKI